MRCTLAHRAWLSAHAACPLACALLHVAAFTLPGPSHVKHIATSADQQQGFCECSLGRSHHLHPSNPRPHTLPDTRNWPWNILQEASHPHLMATPRTHPPSPQTSSTHPCGIPAVPPEQPAANTTAQTATSSSWLCRMAALGMGAKPMLEGGLVRAASGARTLPTTAWMRESAALVSTATEVLDAWGRFCLHHADALWRAACMRELLALQGC